MSARLWSSLAAACCFLLACSNFLPTTAAAAAATKSGTTETAAAAPQRELPFRHKNLDYWDGDTLAAYLSIADDDEVDDDPVVSYAGHDAVVLFYAQWCTNCHALAPLWDQIATLMHAGTRETGLVMALFDCETDARHKKLCSAAGVTHYPTVLYVGHGKYRDADPVTSTLGLGHSKALVGPFGRTKLQHTAKFQGDWRYGQQIMDWMDMMKKFSDWHKWKHGDDASHGEHPLMNKNKNSLTKLLRWMLSPLLPNSNTKDNTPQDSSNNETTTQEMIPVGVPPQVLLQRIVSSSSGNNHPTTTTTTTTNSPTALKDALAKANKLEQQLHKLTQDGQQLKDASSHTGLIVDAMIFTPEDDDDATGDVFAELRDTWDDYSRLADIFLDPASDKRPSLLQSCVVDMGLDYCARFKVRNALDRYDVQEDQKQQEIIDARQEPYCDVLDACVKNNFATQDCRPQQCPFVFEKFAAGACRYTNACLDKDVLNEYRLAVDKAMAAVETSAADNTTTKASTDRVDGGSATTTPTGDGVATKKNGGWGMKK